MHYQLDIISEYILGWRHEVACLENEMTENKLIERAPGAIMKIEALDFNRILRCPK